MEHVLEINEDELELSRFTIDGKIDSTDVSMLWKPNLHCVSYLHMRERIRIWSPISYRVRRICLTTRYRIVTIQIWWELTISNEENVQDNAIGISFRRRDQITPDVIWSVFGKVVQSDATVNALDKLILTDHSIKYQSVIVGESLLRVNHLKHGTFETEYYKS
jgi:hypothetical protein